MSGRIEVNPHIHFGRPYVAGTRIPVADVLGLVAEGIHFGAIARDCALLPDSTPTRKLNPM